VSGSWQFPWDMPAGPVAPPDPDAQAARPKRRGRRPVSVTRAAADVSDWLFHHLTISGPAALVDAFAVAARGSGVTPWQLDYAAIEEDVFARAVSQPAGRRTLTVAGCRILARQFRETVEAHQGRAAALVGQRFACPFDLHALLPVPAAILLLGPAHPAALAWLTAHWGITDRLRQVAVRDNATAGRRLPAGHTVIGYSFFTHRETPAAAIAHLVTRWPALRFVLQHRPLH
jgi:hypothetical protein